MMGLLHPSYLTWDIQDTNDCSLDANCESLLKKIIGKAVFGKTERTV